MKLLVILMGLMISVSAWADYKEVGPGDAFVSCHGDHHGSYLDFITNQDGSQITIVRTDDSGVNEDHYLVKGIHFLVEPKLQKDWEALQALVKDATNESEVWEGYAIISAEAKASSMQIHLNKFDGKSYLSIDGYIEELVCHVPQH